MRSVLDEQDVVSTLWVNRVMRRDRTKTLATIKKTKAELSELVLNEMRKYPGCEKLAAIHIVSDPRGWFITPGDAGVYFSDAAQRAAIAVQIALHNRYITDPD
ncbi:hypothetical protein [Methylorubrum extorquens]|uniref:hypothetical protein n=1 Tax=Methylorubrum extorquens TaxID=408 RepID=UPI0013011562|nr:hypothetical protein [Methylorubrum extorquens]